MKRQLRKEEGKKRRDEGGHGSKYVVEKRHWLDSVPRIRKKKRTATRGAVHGRVCKRVGGYSWDKRNAYDEPRGKKRTAGMCFELFVVGDDCLKKRCWTEGETFKGKKRREGGGGKRKRRRSCHK